MNRKAITIWVCAGIFCLSLFVALMPFAGHEGYFGYGFSPISIVTLLLGWALIIAFCAFLVKSKKKKRSY